MVPHRREVPGGVLVDPLHRGEAMALVLVSVHVCMMLVMEGGGSKLVRVGGGEGGEERRRGEEGSCYVYTRKRRERGGRATEL